MGHCGAGGWGRRHTRKSREVDGPEGLVPQGRADWASPPDGPQIPQSERGGGGHNLDKQEVTMSHRKSMIDELELTARESMRQAADDWCGTYDADWGDIETEWDPVRGEFSFLIFAREDTDTPQKAVHKITFGIVRRGVKDEG